MRILSMWEERTGATVGGGGGGRLGVGEEEEMLINTRAWCKHIKGSKERYYIY